MVGLEYQHVSDDLKVAAARPESNLHSLDSHSPAIFNDDLLNLGVAGEVKIGMDGSSRVDVGVSTIAATTSLSPVSLNFMGKERRERTSLFIHFNLDPVLRQYVRRY